MFSWRAAVFGRTNCLNFGEDPFFFWRTPVFGRKNRFNLLKTNLARKFGSRSEQYFESGAKENFQNQNGPRLEKGWEPLIYQQNIAAILKLQSAASNCASNS